MDGDNVEFEPQDENLKKIDPRMGTPQSVYKVKIQGWERRSLSTDKDSRWDNRSLSI